MRIEVDFDVCKDNHQCVNTAPDLFRVDENGYLAFEANLGESQRSAAEAAADSCPTQAITIVD